MSEPGDLPSLTDILTTFRWWNEALVYSGLGTVEGDVSLTPENDQVALVCPTSQVGYLWLRHRPLLTRNGTSNTWWLKRADVAAFADDARTDTIDVKYDPIDHE